MGTDQLIGLRVCILTVLGYQSWGGGGGGGGGGAESTINLS